MTPFFLLPKCFFDPENPGSKKHEFRPKRRNKSVRLSGSDYQHFHYQQLFFELWSAAARRRFLKRDVSR